MEDKYKITQEEWLTFLKEVKSFDSIWFSGLDKADLQHILWFTRQATESCKKRCNKLLLKEQENSLKGYTAGKKDGCEKIAKEILPQFYNSLINEFKIKKLAKKYGVDIEEIKLLRQKYVGGKQ